MFISTTSLTTGSETEEYQNNTYFLNNQVYLSLNQSFLLLADCIIQK